MYNRLSEIEERNKYLSHTIDKSSQITRELTQQLEQLLLRMGDEMGMQELILIVKHR